MTMKPQSKISKTNKCLIKTYLKQKINCNYIKQNNNTNNKFMKSKMNWNCGNKNQMNKNRKFKLLINKLSSMLEKLTS